MTGGSTDALVIRTVELAPFIERAITEFNEFHKAEPPTGISERFFVEPDSVSQFGALNWIEQETGLPSRVIYRIKRLETKTTAFEIADRLLQGLGYPHAIPTGMVRVIPNPQWSQEKWVQYMRERGCEPEDFPLDV